MGPGHIFLVGWFVVFEMSISVRNQPMASKLSLTSFFATSSQLFSAAAFSGVLS